MNRKPIIIGRNSFPIKLERVRLDKPSSCCYCSGTGKLSVNGFGLRCPKCQGSGKVRKSKEYIYLSVVCEPVKVVSYDELKNWYTDDNGNNYSANSLFSTEEEAIAECNLLNSK